MADNSLFDDWPAYLEWVKQQNAGVNRRNAARLREHKKRSERYRVEAEAYNTRVRSSYERKTEEWQQRYDDYHALPLWRRIGTPKPSIFSMPIRPMEKSTICWEFPLLEPQKQPVFEEFLTWRTNNDPHRPIRSRKEGECMSRNYSVTPTMFVNPYSHAEASVVEPDKQLVDTFHKLLDAISNDNHALAIDHVVAQLLRVHTPPTGQFTPELLNPGGRHASQPIRKEENV